MGTGASPRFAIEYPNVGDTVNVNGDIQTAIDDIDALLFSLSVTSKSASYAATIGQRVKMTGTHTVTSPAASANAPWGAQNAGTGVVTVEPASGLLNLPGDYGASSLLLPNQGDFALFLCDGTNHDLMAGSAAVILPTGLMLSSLAQGGATTGQGLVWNGSGWVPGASGAPGTTVQSFIGSNVGLTGGTPTNLTSISLPAGTYLILGRALVQPSGNHFIDLWAGPNSASTSGAYASDSVLPASSSNYPSLHFSVGNVVLSGTTTVYLTAQGANGDSFRFESLAASVPNVTGITAIRTA